MQSTYSYTILNGVRGDPDLSHCNSGRAYPQRVWYCLKSMGNSGTRLMTRFIADTCFQEVGKVGPSESWLPEDGFGSWLRRCFGRGGITLPTGVWLPLDRREKLTARGKRCMGPKSVVPGCCRQAGHRRGKPFGSCPCRWTCLLWPSPCQCFAQPTP